MPKSSFTASGDNTYDELSDLERVSEQNRQRVEDNLLRMHMQDRAQGEAARIAAMQEEGQTGRLGMTLEGNRGLQESLLQAQERMGGNFADKSAAAMVLQDLQNRGLRDTATINTAPNMLIAKTGQDRFGLERELSAPKLADAQLRGRVTKELIEPALFPTNTQQTNAQVPPRMVGGVTSPVVTPPDGMPVTISQQPKSIITDSMRKRLISDYMGLGQDPEITALLARAGNPNTPISQLGPIFNAIESGDTASAWKTLGEAPAAKIQESTLGQEAFKVSEVQNKEMLLMDKITRTAENWMGASEKDKEAISSGVKDLVKTAGIYGADEAAVMARLQGLVQPKVPATAWPFMRKLLASTGAFSPYAILNGDQFPNAASDVRRLVNLPE